MTRHKHLRNIRLHADNKRRLYTKLAEATRWAQDDASVIDDAWEFVNTLMLPDPHQ